MTIEAPVLEELPLLAVFRAYVRRPKNYAAGVMAQLFATDGSDADAVTSLGLTAIQDSLVDVDIRDDKDVVLGGFNAYLRRPASRESGMVAQFFGEDGDAADAITALSLSRFKDMVVKVVVRQVKKPDGAAVEPERKTKKPPRGPHAASATTLWTSGFLSTPPVWRALGTPEQYLVWMKAQPCCREDGPHDGEIQSGFGDEPAYQALPMCLLHSADTLQLNYTAAQGIKHARAWAWNALREMCGAASMADVDPADIRSWAETNNVANHLPKNY